MRVWREVRHSWSDIPYYEMKETLGYFRVGQERSKLPVEIRLERVATPYVMAYLRCPTADGYAEIALNDDMLRRLHGLMHSAMPSARYMLEKGYTW